MAEKTERRVLTKTKKIQNVATGVPLASLANELISCLARFLYLLHRCQIARLELCDFPSDNFKWTINFQS